MGIKARGVVAAGHPDTAHAAEAVLREGGNAFDAIVAAHLTACVAEPVLSSLAGGGFLLAVPAQGRPLVCDFFVQTPRRKRAVSEIDFEPIYADFGTARQEFHIGLGALATPGCVRGLFEIQRELGRMPMSRLVEPALDLARRGTIINDFQAYIFDIVRPIYLATEAARAIYADPADQQRMVGAGRRLVQAQLADAMEVLSIEGDELFYRGEIAQSIAKLCADGGGHLTIEDLRDYAVQWRTPLARRYRGNQILTNPPPSSGGLLIAFALSMMESTELGALSFGSIPHLTLLAEIMRLTNKARVDVQLSASAELVEAALLDPDLLALYRAQVLGRAAALRGTTHVSVIDAHGNVASMTVSNGEGCGHIVPGTGIMLNNMLGEEDLNLGGFHRWQTDARMTSMMAPSVVLRPDGTRIALGSGGSNRLRSAILQVLSNVIDFDMHLDNAVRAPRIHVEGGHISIENGYSPEVVAQLQAEYAHHTVWSELNLFFGGAHSVSQDLGEFHGTGDPRRGGVATVVN